MDTNAKWLDRKYVSWDNLVQSENAEEEFTENFWRYIYQRVQLLIQVDDVIDIKERKKSKKKDKKKKKGKKWK